MCVLKKYMNSIHYRIQRAPFSECPVMRALTVILDYTGVGLACRFQCNISHRLSIATDIYCVG